MRYFRAFYTIADLHSVNFRDLEPIHQQFDDRVYALPFFRWDDGSDNFVLTLIAKDGNIKLSTVEKYLERSLQLLKITDATLSRFEETTLENCFVGYQRNQFRSYYDEDNVKKLLNLSSTFSFIYSNNYGMRESIISEPLELNEAKKLASITDYSLNLQKELDSIGIPPQGKSNESSNVLPINYIVEGNAQSDTDEATNILLRSLIKAGRINSQHVFTINVDEYLRWPSTARENNHAICLNSQLIRAIEGNNLVIRYGDLENSTGFDLEAYQILTKLLDLVAEANCKTQLIISVPENKPDLVTRLRKRFNSPFVIIKKNEGARISNESFEKNLAEMQKMASDQGYEPDEMMSKLLLKRMMYNNDLELESIFKEWKSYHNTCVKFPHYAPAIMEAIELGMDDSALDAEEKLNALIGLESVKETIKNIVLRVEMNQRLIENGLPPQQFSMHMAFLGSPGTGKTEVARLYAEILKNHGIIKEGRLVTVSGGAKFDIEKAFEAAKGSVLFIDEAYGLFGCSSLIAELIAQMENNRSDTVVILAGYEGHMDALLDSNPGFRSRLGFTIKFPDYTAEELQQIFTFMCEKQRMILEDGALEIVRDSIARGGRRSDQGNARFIRKMFEDALGAQQVRLAKQCKEDPNFVLNVDTLRTITSSDIEQSTQSAKNGSENEPAREQLESLIGLEEVKKLVSARLDFAKMQKAKRDAGMNAPFVPMHMAFKGNPGTGKTEVARLIGRILNEEGILSVGDFYECGRQDLVSPIVGATAPMIEDLFQKARGSVIFIDEAYSLLDGRKGGSGDEAITTIIDQMEKLRDEVVVIFAGYPDEIDALLDANPGFASRVKINLDFPDYSAEELAEILEFMAKGQGYSLAEGVSAKTRDIVSKALTEKNFGNARFARTLIENALVNQSVRLASKMAEQEEPLSVAELSTLLPEDFEWTPSSTTPVIGFAA